MTKAEIIAMATEAGLLPDNSHPAPETRAMRQRSEAVQRFATLVAARVAAKEREACCAPDVTNSAGICAADMPHVVVQKYQSAIRARGQKEGA